MLQLGFWHLAQQNPDALALVDPEGREWSRGDLFKECNRIAHGLRALGLQKGDSVAALLPNCAEFLALNLAVTQLGMYLVPINWHLAASEVAYILKDSGAKVFVSHARIEGVASAAATEVGLASEACFSIGDLKGFRHYQELVKDQPVSLPEERLGGMVRNYTSGTTGNPKAVVRAAWEIDPETMAQSMTGMLALFGIAPEDDNVHFCGSPLYHTGVMVWAINSLHFGHAVVMVEKWDAQGMLAAIDRYKVTTSHMVPTQFTRLLKLPDEIKARYDVSSTRHMIHAAAPCPPDIKRAMIDWWGLSIFEYYAATEGGGTLVGPREWLQHPGTVGKAWPGADIKIVDDEGQDVPTGEKGTVYMLMSDVGRFEYKGDKAKTEKDRLGDYFTAGDVGYLNDEGYLFLCDRKIDMIISGGANIYPAEIENVLILHPKVADCCVFGIPNSDWGEEIKAVVQPASGVPTGEDLSNELITFCADKLAKMKLPRSFDYLKELPRDPNGKLYKRRLRDPYWEKENRQL
ncbi:acyl-CoA synthetase [Seongchinamella sediminis]|uniref:Acyl-CoA synthetase n=1 Tax=Seongchinamella sediminis TaxID=2283635 RepID=A0A3L7DTT7_9GAMM|nr:acyl-CoA synthetase [Seongchinamella sediminis]RLQ20185.1 acyl-CoA synthetase [Seongchinamella sediminis]